MRCGTTATATFASRVTGAGSSAFLHDQNPRWRTRPVRDGPVGEDEGVDSFNDFLAIIARCLPDDVDAFARAAYLWAGLHGRVALGDAIPTFPWPTEDEYIERMLRDPHHRPSW
jgi:hypothetical protein